MYLSSRPLELFAPLAALTSDTRIIGHRPPACQRLPPTLLSTTNCARRLAVFLHGAAGDLAEAEERQVSMTATDVIACLGEALNRLMKPVSDQAGQE